MRHEKVIEFIECDKCGTIDDTKFQKLGDSFELKLCGIGEYDEETDLCDDCIEELKLWLKKVPQYL